MKKKITKVIASGLLIVGSIVPTIVSASTSWNFGYSPSSYTWYNKYYNSSRRHFVTIAANNKTYYSGIAGSGTLVSLTVGCTGPYIVTYSKFDC